MWYDKPTKIRKLSSEIEYIMCIDENGSSNNLTYMLKQISNNKEVLEDDKYFTITGCIFKRQDYMNSKYAIKELKNKYWKDGMFYDSKQKDKRSLLSFKRNKKTR